MLLRVQPPNHAQYRRWLVLVVLCFSLLVIVLDNTVLNVALPSIVRQLGGVEQPTAVHAHDFLAFVTRAVPKFGPAGQQLLSSARAAFLDGMHTAMWTGGSILATGAVVAWLHRAPA